MPYFQAMTVALVANMLATAQPALATADGPDYWQTTEEPAVPLHALADSGSTRLDTIPPGTDGLVNQGCKGRLTLEEWNGLDETEQAIARNNVWCEITFAGRTGWVQGKFLGEGSGPLAPGFDCARAEGEVEQLICDDPGLALLDNKLNEVYASSLQVSAGLDAGAKESVNILKATQRGWISGRNDCWKDLPDKAGCIRTAYYRRIAYLQAKWSLADQGVARYFKCKDDQATFHATFYESDFLPSVSIEYGDSRVIFVSSPVASGSRFDGEFGRYVWFKGDEAIFVWDQNAPGKSCKRTSD